MRIKNNKNWYSIIISLLIIGFLLVLTSWIFKLVLLEMWDNRWLSNYLKASAAVEWAWELALLAIKQNWYAYDDSISHDINNRSIILANNSEDISQFNKAKDVFISFDYNYTVSEYEWELKSAWYDIIPLFYLDDTWEKKAKKLNLDILSWWDSSSLAWNIIWISEWISWVWEFDNTTVWKWRKSNWDYFSRNMWDFLDLSNSNYLVVLNLDPSNTIKYNLKSENPWEFFTKPRTYISVSAQIWSYKQNLDLFLDNTEFLNILKYSIYSN